MWKRTGRASVRSCASRFCSRWASCCWPSRSTRRSRCCRSIAPGRAWSRTRPIWSCRGRSTRPGSRSTTSRPALGRGTTARLDPNLPLALRMGRKHLDDALGVIDRYLEKEPKSSRRAGLREPAAPDRRAGRAAGRRRRASWGRRRPPSIPRRGPEFESHFAMLTHNLNRMRRPLRGESGQIAQRLSDDEETALSMAIALGAAGLAVAGAAFLFTLRTLRPLSVLRAHARQLGGGDYSQRTGRHVARRDRRSGARVRRDGGGDPGARASPDPVGAPRHRRADGGAHRARGSQPAGVDRPQRRVAGRRDRRPRRGGAAAGHVDHRRGRPADRDHRDLPARSRGCRGRSWNARTSARSWRRSWRCRAASWPRPASASPSTSRPGCPMSRPTRRSCGRRSST